MTEELFSDEFYKKHNVDPFLDYQKAIFLGQQIVNHIKETKGAIFGLPLFKFQIDKFKGNPQKLESLVRTQEFIYRKLTDASPEQEDFKTSTVFTSAYPPLPDSFYQKRGIDPPSDYKKAVYLSDCLSSRLANMLAEESPVIHRRINNLVNEPERLTSLVHSLETVYQAFFSGDY